MERASNPSSIWCLFAKADESKLQLTTSDILLSSGLDGSTHGLYEYRHACKRWDGVIHIRLHTP
jgi:hypothetical protein